MKKRVCQKHTSTWFYKACLLQDLASFVQLRIDLGYFCKHILLRRVEVVIPSPEICFQLPEKSLDMEHKKKIYSWESF